MRRFVLLAPIGPGAPAATLGGAAPFDGPGLLPAKGFDPASQIEMTAGMFGYRPKGFATPYGRTSPWEDKAEVLAYAIRKELLPTVNYIL